MSERLWNVYGKFVLYCFDITAHLDNVANIAAVRQIAKDGKDDNAGKDRGEGVEYADQ